MFDMLFRIW